MPTTNEADLLKKSKSPSSVLVVMDDRGAAELVIDNGSKGDDGTRSIIGTPTKPLKSLLDDEEPSTPSSPAKSLTTRTPSSAAETLLCCGKIEGTIDALLSRPIRGALGTALDWQVWSFPYLGLINGATTVGLGTEEERKEAKKVLRNRAFSVSERRRRMDSVRRHLAPFSLTPTRAKRSSPLRFGKVNSFDIVLHRSKGSIPTTSKNRNRETDISSLVEMCGVGCSPKKPDSPAIIRSSMLEAVHEDACYDSDPEDFTRRQSLRHLSPTPTKKVSPGNKENNNLGQTNKMVTHYRNSGIDSEDYISQSVQAFLNEKFTLILHTAGSEAKPCAPHAVKAWFERGQHLSYNIIQPRLCWHNFDCKSSKRRVALSNVQRVSSIDLVDIARVLSVDSVDRQLYPFAKTASCLLIKTLDTAYLFEAKTKSERERLARWLKVTVSRLASKLIVGDHTLFEEFFVNGMLDNSPGEGPAFF